MNKNSGKPRRLVLNRETLLRLDERRLRAADGAGAGRIDQWLSQDTKCTSPLCVETTCNCAEIG
jgi:hypothetical protein